MLIDGKALGEQLVAIFKDYVARATAGIGARIDALETAFKQFTASHPEVVGEIVRDAVKAAVAEIPAPKDGKDADAAAIIRAVTEAVGALPKPADGKSVTIDEVRPVLEVLVRSAVDALPKPKDGQDADQEAITKAVLRDVLVQLPKLPDVPTLIAEHVKEAIEALPKQELPDVARAVADAIERLPAPRDGKDADPELVKQLVAQAFAEIPRPQDGKSVTLDDVKPLLSELVDKAVGLIPKPKDGESVPIEQVEILVAQEVAKAMAAVRMPKDGEPGRDATHIEILPAIDEARSYPRGTFARHEGGLWRSFETTSAMKGWECIADAIADVSLEQVGERTIAFEVRLAGGKTSRKEVVFPVTIHRGIWKDGEAYARGDATTRDGSTWILMADQQKGKPGEDGSGWVLSTKRGRDGRDGLRGQKGERGAEGRPGRDLTQMGFDGSKH